ncbi:hypothetical protein DPMN_004741 [Dreissena polymorpha]|uniref:Uncharacterized protein n=1 Tax=Dreissena polymorpha TaxID=45954 RepID=A0A9D4MRV8_DREPO|nr:hypothetical protein DPMN_004741 [Dreissena polymorpha]
MPAAVLPCMAWSPKRWDLCRPEAHVGISDDETRGPWSELIHEDWNKKVTSRVLIQYLIGTNVLTKKIAPATGSHIFSTNQKNDLTQPRTIITTDFLTKFHKELTLNVASRLLIRKTAPSPNIIGTHVQSKFHENWTINVNIDDQRRTKGDHKS